MMNKARRADMIIAPGVNPGKDCGKDVLENPEGVALL